MRTLDPRLVSRTRAARPLLVADAAMGIATAAPVIVQATVLAGVVTRAFGRDPSARLGAAAAVLVAAFAVRGALAWGMEVAGRRAAASVLSELRLDLAGRRLRTQPLATDGVQSGEVVAASVQGIEALEAYFGRYLPQAVLATVVPVVGARVGRHGRPDVGAHHAAHAAPGAGVHVAHRPVHGAAHARAVVGAAAAFDAFPRRRARAADAARVRPRPRAAGRPSPRSGRRYRARRWRRCGSRSCRARCSNSPRRSAWRSSR